MNKRSVGTFLALLFIAASQDACARWFVKPIPDPMIEVRREYPQRIEQWHQDRWQELNSESGWLTLVGLFWLKDGDNTFGSDSANDLVLANKQLDSHAGKIVVRNGVVRLETNQKGFIADNNPAQSLELKTDAEVKPTIVRLGSLSFQIIKRGEKLGLRVKDSQNPDRLNFKGTEFYPADLKWCLVGKFEPYNPPKPMPITNVLGMDYAESSPGAIVFTIDGQQYRLDAITEQNESRLFVIMADKTSGKETYPAGRYLYVYPPDDASGRVVIDFNKAFSPPCAFTKFATCPLPPRQNRLPVAIEAGEKYQPHIAN